MKRIAALLLLAAGCQTELERAPHVWYDQAEIVCRVESCGACGGRGHVGCRPCRGDGTVPCTHCKNGKRKCGTCNGDGSYKGKKCKPCGGDGWVTCSSCGGDRLMDCDVCLGKGRLHCVRAIRITEPMPAGEDVWPPQPARP